MRLLFILFMSLFMINQADAYSYSAAGKEPLIDGRNGIINALNTKDDAKVAEYFGLIHDDVEFLGNKYDKTLLADFEQAIKDKNEKTITRSIHRLFAAEIQRRMKTVRRNMDNYQIAKTGVIKSFRFFDVIAADYPADQRKKIRAGLQDCLNAVGKPGMFGAGSVTPDPVAFDHALIEVVKAFAQ